MTKQAERPLTVSFIEGSSCTFDSNDFVEFEILTHDLPMGEIVFKGNPFTDAGLTELGRCVYDYCDHGLYVYQYLANMLYEAQHPWLSYKDAVKHGVFKEDSKYLYMVINVALPIVKPWIFLEQGLWKKPNYGEYNSLKVMAVKPINSIDFVDLNQVAVWKPTKNELQYL